MFFVHVPLIILPQCSTERDLEAGPHCLLSSCVASWQKNFSKSSDEELSLHFTMNIHVSTAVVVALR